MIDPEQLRMQLSADVETARHAFHRALEPGEPNTFTWGEVRCWVDRVRWVVAPAFAVKTAGFADATTAPDTEAGRDVLELFGAGHRSATSDGFLKWLARRARSVNPIDSSLAGNHFVNLVVVQPLINPAFEPLFWIDLASDLGKRFARNNIFAELAPMMFDMTTWPASRAEAATVRKAQMDFVETVEPGWAVRAEALSDEQWIAACHALGDKWRTRVDNRVFDSALEYAL